MLPFEDRVAGVCTWRGIGKCQEVFQGEPCSDLRLQNCITPCVRLKELSLFIWLIGKKAGKGWLDSQVWWRNFGQWFDVQKEPLEALWLSRFWRKLQCFSRVIYMLCSFILKYWAYYVEMLGKGEWSARYCMQGRSFLSFYLYIQSSDNAQHLPSSITDIGKFSCKWHSLNYWIKSYWAILL